MKRIMILGASATQLPLIKQAKKTGLYTIVASIPGDYPGFAYADKVSYVNITDRDAVLEEAKKEKIDGIVTTGSEIAVRSVGYVNSRLGLHGISEDSSLLVTDKAKMKQAMKDYGVSTADFRIVHNSEEAERACAEIGFPVMAKCTDQAGSKGISRVMNSTELQEAVENAFSWTKNDYIVIEKFIDGYEVGMDGYVDDDENCLCFPHNMMTYNNGKTNVPIGHSIPYRVTSQNDYDNLLEEAKKCAKALQLKGCFFNTDVMISNGKAYIIEMCGRTGATCIPEILSAFCGYNYYEKMLLNALGMPVNMDFTQKCACAAGYITSKRDGKVKELPILSDKERRDATYTFDVSVGDDVRKFRLGSDRIGEVICTAESLDKAEAKFEQIQKILSDGIVFE